MRWMSSARLALRALKMLCFWRAISLLMSLLLRWCARVPADASLLALAGGADGGASSTLHEETMSSDERRRDRRRCCCDCLLLALSVVVLPIGVSVCLATLGESSVMSIFVGRSCRINVAIFWINLGINCCCCCCCAEHLNEYLKQLINRIPSHIYQKWTFTRTATITTR